MQFHLVLPGLGWAAGPSAAQPELPALAALLGHAQHRWLPATAPEPWLAGRFGLVSTRLPYAALRRAGEATPSRADTHWLCADPVHLRFAREHLILTDASTLAVRRDEADTLIPQLSLRVPFCSSEQTFPVVAGRPGPPSTTPIYYRRLQHRGFDSTSVGQSRSVIVVPRAPEGFTPLWFNPFHHRKPCLSTGMTGLSARFGIPSPSLIRYP